MRATTSSSNMHRRLRCPGSHHAEHGLPEQDGEWAEEGTELHRLFADKKASRDHLTPKQRDLLEIAEATTAEILEAVYLSRSILEDEPFEEGYERELWLRRGLKPLIPGHCDYWRYFPRLKLLVILDQKFGFLVVESAESNVQLRTYAVQGAEEWDVDAAVVAISQPRSFEQRKTIAIYERADLLASRAQLLDAWDACQKPDAPLIASEEACRYCKAQLGCEVYTARIGGALPLAIVNVADLSDADMETLWTAVKMAADDRFSSAVKAEVQKRIMEGRMPEFTLVPNAPRRKITDAIKAVRLLTEGDGAKLTRDQVLSAAKLSFGELTTIYRKSLKVTEKAAKADLDEALGDTIDLETPAPTIKKISGKMLK